MNLLMNKYKWLFLEKNSAEQEFFRVEKNCEKKWKLKFCWVSSSWNPWLVTNSLAFILKNSSFIHKVFIKLIEFFTSFTFNLNDYNHYLGTWSFYFRVSIGIYEVFFKVTNENVRLLLVILLYFQTFLDKLVRVNYCYLMIKLKLLIWVHFWSKINKINNVAVTYVF